MTILHSLPFARLVLTFMYPSLWLHKAAIVYPTLAIPAQMSPPPMTCLMSPWLTFLPSLWRVVLWGPLLREACWSIFRIRVMIDQKSRRVKVRIVKPLTVWPNFSPILTHMIRMGVTQ